MDKSYTEQDICDWYVAGDGCPAISKRTGRSQSYLDAVLRRHGITKRKAGRQPNIPRPERRKPAYLLEAAVARYVAGESAKHIGSTGPVSKYTLLRELHRRGIPIRLQRLDLSVDIVEAYRLGSSANAIAQKLQVSKQLILRRLADGGVEATEIRSYVPRYKHTSPIAGLVSLRGTWEKVYAIFLDRLWSSGRISSWTYEPDKIALSSGRIYIPDFKVISNDGAASYHEVKGRLAEAAKSKIVEAREAGHHIVLLRSQILAPLFKHQGLRATI